MATNFPTGLDTFPSAATLSPASNKLSTQPHSLLHGNLGDAVAALQAKMGITGSAVTSSIDYLLTNATSSNPGHRHTAAHITGLATVATTGAYANLSGTPTIPAAANPTGTIGLAAVNGSAATFLRSDGAPALSQTITPTWTGQHIWSLSNAAAVSIGPNGDTNPTLRVVTNVASAATGISITGNAAGSGATITVLSSAADDNLAISSKGTMGTITFTAGSSPGSGRIDMIAAGVSARLTDNGFFPITGGSIDLGFSGGSYSWKSLQITGGVYFDTGGTIDAGLKRNAAGSVEFNNGTAGQWGAIKCGTRDAGTTTITDAATLGHQSTGTPAAGLGTAILANINSTTTADQAAGRISWEWATATHASRAARGKLTAYYTTTERECVRFEADSSAALIGFLGATAVARQTGGEDVTNSVTDSGSTAGTIPDITDGTIYANDYTNLRRALFQLARMLKQDHDALRDYGLLT